MPYIPKKVVNRFVTSVPKFQKVLKLAKYRDINESPTSSDSKQSISLSDRLLEESNDSSQSTIQQKNSPDKK